MLLVLLIWLAVVAVWNLALLYYAHSDWAFVQTYRINGARAIIAFGLVRRKSVRCVTLFCLIALLFNRAVLGLPASPATIAICFSILVCVQSIDVTLDWFDRRAIRWFLRTELDGEKKHA